MNDYLVSRNEDFSDVKVNDEMVRFNIWKNKMWPYRNVELGDKINLFSTTSRRIETISEIIDLVKEKFKSKEELTKLLEVNGGSINNSYVTKEKESQGYLILYKLKVLKKTIDDFLENYAYSEADIDNSST